jgi:hypothetical protein
LNLKSTKPNNYFLFKIIISKHIIVYYLYTVLLIPIPFLLNKRVKQIIIKTNQIQG